MSKKKITYIDTRQKSNQVTIDLKEIESMAALGLSQEEIALIKGIAPETLSRIKKRNFDISQAIESGKAKDRSTLVGGLRKIATSGENDAVKTTASKYLLNVLHGINEKHGVEGTMKHSGEVTHRVSMEDFEEAAKKIDNES